MVLTNTRNARILVLSGGEATRKTEETIMNFREYLNSHGWLEAPSEPDAFDSLTPIDGVKVINVSRAFSKALDCEADIALLSDGRKYISDGPAWTVE